MSEPPDEFAWIDKLRPLARGDRGALDLRDDAAIIAHRPGFDLIVSTDAMVEGVHFAAGEPPEMIARRLLRTSLSDLAAKAAAPFGYLLMTAWPADRDWHYRKGFIRGLKDDGEVFDVALLGGDTVATSGPLTLCATVLGWAPAGGAVLRSGARPGDLLIVCGAIGDGWLGLAASQGRVPDPHGRLAARYRLPTPLLALREALQAYAHAAADVSDGLLADAGNIALASGVALSLDIERFPVSPEADAWCSAQSDARSARLALAGGGDDYAIVCAVDPADEMAFTGAVRALGLPARRAGSFAVGEGLEVTAGGATIAAPRLGWRH
jgi:thiamine-monophosphate kinase